MVKDRLADLRAKSGISCNDESDSGKSTSVTQALLSEESDSSLEGFLSRVTVVNSKLEQMEGFLVRIKQIHNSILSHPDTDRGLMDELTNLYHKFRQDAMEVRQLTKAIDAEANSKNVDGSSEHGVEHRIRSIHYRTIVARLYKVSDNFNKEQNDYKDRRKKNITQYLKIQGINLDEDVVMDAVEKGDVDGMTKGLVLAVADKKALYHEVKARRDEIFSVEQSTLLLHELFHDLHLLVLSQGEMIDNIEANVQSAVDYAEKAKDNVVGARTLQKRARKMKVCICIGLIVLAIILFFVIQGLVCHFTPIC